LFTHKAFVIIKISPRIARANGRYNIILSIQILVINYSGGKITVNAEGDGRDSNGNLTVSGGETYVSGPTKGGNGGIDYNGTATITGGTIIVTEIQSMTEIFGSDSTQGVVQVSVSNQAAGTTVSIADSKGNVLASYTPSKEYNSVIISTAGMVQGETYTVTAGTETKEVTLSRLVSSSNGMNGGPGGNGGPRGNSINGDNGNFRGPNGNGGSGENGNFRGPNGNGGPGGNDNFGGPNDNGGPDGNGNFGGPNGNGGPGSNGNFGGPNGNGGNFDGGHQGRPEGAPPSGGPRNWGDNSDSSGNRNGMKEGQRNSSVTKGNSNQSSNSGQNSNSGTNGNSQNNRNSRQNDGSEQSSKSSTGTSKSI